MRIGLISDTHGLLRNEVYGAFEGVDEILHAGDLGDPAILTALEVIAPVQAVHGNVDGWEVREQAADELRLDRDGCRIAVVHGHQWGSPKPEGLAERYAEFDVVVYGHTHQPRIDLVGGVLVVNPGSAGPQRFRDPVTVAILTVDADGGPQARLVRLLD